MGVFPGSKYWTSASIVALILLNSVQFSHCETTNQIDTPENKIGGELLKIWPLYKYQYGISEFSRWESFERCGKPETVGSTSGKFKSVTHFGNNWLICIAFPRFDWQISQWKQKRQIPSEEQWIPDINSIYGKKWMLEKSMHQNWKCWTFPKCPDAFSGNV